MALTADWPPTMVCPGLLGSVLEQFEKSIHDDKVPEFKHVASK